MNNEQMTQEQRAQLIEKLHAEYNDLNGKIARLNAFLCSIDFVKKVPDIAEQELMKGQLRAMKTYLDNLRGRIMFQESHQKKNEMQRQALDDWMNWKVCGHDENKGRYKIGLDVSCSVGDGNAAVITGDSLKELVGMQIVSVFPPGWKCQGCAFNNSYFRCEKKVELVGGFFLCLAPLPNTLIIE